MFRMVSKYLWGAPHQEKKTAVSGEPVLVNASTDAVSRRIIPLAEARRLAELVSDIQTTLAELRENRALPAYIQPEGSPAPSNQAILEKLHLSLDDITELYRDDYWQEIIMTFPVKLDSQDVVDFDHWLAWCHDHLKEHEALSSEFVNPRSRQPIKSIEFDRQLYQAIHQFMVDQALIKEREARRTSLQTSLIRSSQTSYLINPLLFRLFHEQKKLGLASALQPIPGVYIPMLLTADKTTSTSNNATPAVTEMNPSPPAVSSERTAESTTATPAATPTRRLGGWW